MVATRITAVSVLFFVLLSLVQVQADLALPALPYSVYSVDKRLRADSLPYDSRGRKGQTRIYRIHGQSEELLHTYNWYAWRMLIAETPSGIAVVRLCGWPEGIEASHETFAFAFYLDGEELKSYSTLDIAGRPDNVRSSSSHHIAFRPPTQIFYREIARRYEFRIQRMDGRYMFFDIETGRRVQ